MASALNMDEGSDTTTHTDIVEERENEGKGRQGRQKGRSIKWNLRWQSVNIFVLNNLTHTFSLSPYPLLTLPCLLNPQPVPLGMAV